ncbi:hypothetical protein QBC40DRAFT_92191 [Triangularia verruculosa]|uniref:Uncharacterized protein n=1 Tax=Triangularia verruculosa TaxID=2587418 RepID=A0AAN7ATH9_9PEZI|nr:hypothetical protein QBC40DRAFT_92191 [Triangularia verruculosa]
MTPCPKTTPRKTKPIMGPPLPSIAPDVLQQDPPNGPSRRPRYRIVVVDAGRNYRHRSKDSPGSLVNDDCHSSMVPRSRFMAPSARPSEPHTQNRYVAEEPVEHGLSETDRAQIEGPVLVAPLHNGRTRQPLPTRSLPTGDRHNVPSSAAPVLSRVSCTTTFRGSSNFGCQRLSFSAMRPSLPTFWSPAQICLANKTGRVDPALSERSSVTKTDTAFRVKTCHNGENNRPLATGRDIRGLSCWRGLSYTKASPPPHAFNVLMNSENHELQVASPDFCYASSLVPGRFWSLAHDVLADLLALDKEVEQSSRLDDGNRGNTASLMGSFLFGQVIALANI